jgi:hypothetical protein
MLSSNHFEAVLQLSNMATNNIEEVSQVLEFLQTWYRDLYLLKEGLPLEKLYNHDMIDEMWEAIHGESKESIMKKMKKLQWIECNMQSNINLSFALESTLTQAS